MMHQLVGEQRDEHKTTENNTQMPSIDDMLDERMTGGGDYPDWWEPEDEGETLEGLVAEKRLDPWAEENDDDDPGHILHVKTLDGEEYSTRTHKVLTNLIKEQGVEVGDLVRIEYTGQSKTDSGHNAYGYRLGVIKADELDDLDIDVSGARSGNPSSSPSESSDDEDDEGAKSDGGMTPAEAGAAMADPSEVDIETSDEETPEDDDEPTPAEFTVAELEDLVETIDDRDQLDELMAAEKENKDRKSAKSVIAGRATELEPDEEESGDVPEEAVEFVESLISFHGSLDEDDMNEYLNETRGFGVDVQDVADAAGLVKNDDGEYVEE